MTEKGPTPAWTWHWYPDVSVDDGSTGTTGGMTERLRELMIRTGSPVGTVFLLGPDLRPDVRINAYLASRATRAKSVLTIKKYVCSLVSWLNFLSKIGVAWDTAIADDIDTYKFWRISDKTNPKLIQGQTFLGDLAAISVFYDWISSRTEIRNPVVKETVHSRNTSAANGPLAGATRVATPKVARKSSVKWLTPRAFRRFNEVGLQGFSRDGTEDPNWQGRNSQRDSVFADALYGSGLRLTELASLLVDEIPGDTRQGFFTQSLAAACAKNTIGRHYWITRMAVEGLWSYQEIERAAAVRAGQQSGRYEKVSGREIVVSPVGDSGIRVRRAGGDVVRVVLDELDPGRRRKLYRLKDGKLQPVCLWLNENGLPRDPHAWDRTFERASERMASSGYKSMKVTPHMLRHSFALRWYSVGRLMYERRFAHLGIEELKDFRTQFGDTWHLVQTLLGHRDVGTTMNVYLEPFRELDVSLLLQQAEGLDVQGLLERHFRDHPRVLHDPVVND
jgi:site-specific recombinase XerD